MRPVILALAALAASPLNGTWVGVYRSMPERLLPDGFDPERVNRFKLTFGTRNGANGGRFEPVGEGMAPAPEIRN
jgi:hypothetical protein